MTELIRILEVSRLNAPQCLTLAIPYQDSVIDERARSGMDGTEFEILLVCYGGNQLVAYLNQCPHTGVNLNWQQNQCFDSSQRYLACSLHGACIYGPCRGESLKRVPLIVDGGAIFIDPPDLLVTDFKR